MQKPLAVVVVGGMTLAPVLILIVLPAMIALVSRRERADESEEAAIEHAHQFQTAPRCCGGNLLEIWPCAILGITL